MYNSDFAQIATESCRIEDIWQEVKTLTTAEKAELVKRLLGKESGLLLVSSSNHLADYIIAEISLLSKDGLTYVMRAIADRIAADGIHSRH